jgi:hypothetical protein
MYDLPLYIWALVLIPAIGFPLATSVALYRGAVATGLGRGAALGVGATTGAVLGGWLVISGLLAGTGVYQQDPGDAIPWLPIAAAGFLIALLLATRLPLVSRILGDVGTAARLTLPHTLRIAGVVFLIVMALGHLPAAFALPAGSPRPWSPDGWPTASVAMRRCGSTSSVWSISSWLGASVSCCSSSSRSHPPRPCSCCYRSRSSSP